MNELFIKLFSHISDGVVIFEMTGEVIFSNLEKSRFEGVVVDNKIVDDNIMKEAAEIHANKINDVKEIKVNMVEHIENDSDVVLFQNESVFCLYIKDELDRARYQTLRDNMFELINHELRTPMNHFTGGAFLVTNMLEENKGEIKDTEEFNSFIKVIADSIKEMTTKMNRLLDLSVTYGDDPIRDKARIDIIEVAKSAIDSLKEMSSSKKIVVKLDKKDDVIGNLYGSFGWLKRAIEECVKNSIEHSNDGDEVHLQIEQNDYFAHITIRDFGRGISPKVKHALFEPFNGGGDKDEFSNQGLGIGLTLAQTIIENHGGNIKYIETKDGVEFHIELPTGGVKTSSDDLDIRQSQLYARDLAVLMKKNASH